MVAAYEEERNKILEQNRKKFLDLGITQISKTLSNLTAEKKPQKVWKPKPKNSAFEAEPRRSTRQRNPIQSYVDDVDIGLPTRKRLRLRTSSAPFGSHNGRPLEECRMASYEERTAAFKAAERLQESLESENPSFVKSMLRSHVYSCFWLGLPSRFCEEHLPKSADTDFVLEDENGEQWDSKYLANRTGLSGGWRGFALEHKLDDGDALVFELIEPARFKIHVVKVTTQEHCQKDKVEKSSKPSRQPRNQAETSQNQGPKRATTPETIDMETPPELLPESPKSESVVPYRLRKRVRN